MGALIRVNDKRIIGFMLDSIQTEHALSLPIHLSSKKPMFLFREALEYIVALYLRQNKYSSYLVCIKMNYDHVPTACFFEY